MTIQGYVKQAKDGTWTFAVKIDYPNLGKQEFYQSKKSYVRSSDAAQALSVHLKTLEDVLP